MPMLIKGAEYRNVDQNQIRRHAEGRRIGRPANLSDGDPIVVEMECALDPLSLPKKFKTKSGVSWRSAPAEVAANHVLSGVVELCLVARVDQLRAELAGPIFRGGRPPLGGDRDGGPVSYRKCSVGKHIDSVIQLVIRHSVVSAGHKCRVERCVKVALSHRAGAASLNTHVEIGL
jgi:hypothetical protein